MRNPGTMRQSSQESPSHDAKETSVAHIGGERSNTIPFRFRGGSGVPQQELQEAYEWHRLFNEGWITAHEMRGLPAAAQPAREGELFKIETENLLRIKELMQADISDKTFREKLKDIRELLPRPFGSMVGMRQTSPHGGIDPVDHTLNMLKLLDTGGLAGEDREIARAVGVFHDIGKVFDPKDRDHPRRSKNIAADYLVKMGYANEIRDRILNHIEWHDALGEVARRDGRNILEPRDVATYFPNEEELALHKRIVKADVESIPGLRKYAADIDAAYHLMSDRLRAERDFIDVWAVARAPDDAIDNARLERAIYDLWEEKEFDSIDVWERQWQQQDAWREYSIEHPEDAQMVEQALVRYSQEGNERALKLLQLTGRETDRTIVTELEEKYHTRLDQLRLSVELFSLTYHIWNIKNDVSYASAGADIDPELKEKMRRQLKEIKKSADFLSSYRVEATHATDFYSAEQIDTMDTLQKSVTGESSHYEGDGVYVGVLGSYRSWKSDQVYEMRVPLADTLPTIVSYNYPKAMANVLCEGLYIKNYTETPAVAHGVIQWRQNAFSDEPLDDWKIELMEELLGSKVQVVYDDEGLACMIADTDQEPIIWGTLARALMIRRFIPRSELSKLALDFEEIVETRSRNVRGVSIEIPVMSEEHLETMALRAVKIRGIKGKNIGEYL